MRWMAIPLVCGWWAGSAGADVPMTVASPDGQVVFALSVTDAGPVFRASLDEQVHFVDSPLGLLPRDAEPLGPGSQIVAVKTTVHDETYTLAWGRRSPMRDHYWLLGRIPEMVAYERGPNASRRGLSHGLRHAVLFTFRSKQELTTYLDHPAHREFITKYKPWLANLLVIDWEVPEA